MTVSTLKWRDRIREHSGMDTDDIISAGAHGADAGWPGFTYYTDTSAFVDKYRDDIMDMVGADAEDFGYDNALAFMGSWRCADTMNDATGMDNGLAWYILETVGRDLETMRENDEDLEDDDEDDD